MKTKESRLEAKRGTLQRRQRESSNGGTAALADNRAATIVQRKLQAGMNTSAAKPTLQRKNNTGLPDHLKSGIENLSGYSMDDVKVHYNSSKPAQLQAHAYAQGNDIHLASGQEKHLPHEAWHVVQQKQGRVKPTMQLKSKVNINDDVGLEKEADVMGAKAANATNKFINNSNRPRVVRHKPIIQRYAIYNANQYQTQGAGNSFTAQVRGLGANRSFIDPNTQLPRLNHAAGPQIRVSTNGNLAIEDAQLANRQPKFFYADQGMIATWNNALLAKGSHFELVAVPAQMITLAPPNGGANQQLVKVEARNRVQNNQGLNMTVTQSCNLTIQEVLGVGLLEPHIPNALQLPGLPLDIGARNYYLAAELAHVANGGNTNNLGGANWGIGGMPANGITGFYNAAILNPIFNTIANNNYGAAMHQHIQGGNNNNALDARMQQLEVNEYANPEVGEGMMINSLGFSVQNGNVRQLADDYNNRVLNNPNNATELWPFHYGGVIAKDGTDYITLENYARNAEDQFFPLGAQDPRFYFQMYGPGAQSWHTQWAAIGHGGRELTNPLSYVIRMDEDTQIWDARAARNFGHNIAGIRDDYNALPRNPSKDEKTIWLLKGLAYANHILGNNPPHGYFVRVLKWIWKVYRMRDRAVWGLRNHVLSRLKLIQKRVNE